MKYTLLTAFVTDCWQKIEVCFIRLQWRSLFYHKTNLYFKGPWSLKYLENNVLQLYILALTTGNPVNLISTKGSRRVWPVGRGCLLLRDSWSYLCICRRSVLPYTRFCNCLFNYDCVLYMVNFAILYIDHNYFFRDDFYSFCCNFFSSHFWEIR
jgi:hypothetical protein